MIVRVKVKPGSRTSGLQVADDGTYVAQVKASPVDGMANAELVELLARHFKCRKSAVSIKSGAGSRMKLVKIDCE